MTYWQRIRKTLTGLVMILTAVLVSAFPKYGFTIIGAILCTTLLITGIRQIVYYLSLARYMVGGRYTLYKGVVLFDLGVFTMTLNSVPKLYMVIYLVVVNAIAGVVFMLRARDAKAMETSAWKADIVSGGVYLLMAVLSAIFGFFTDSINMVVYIYAGGLIITAVVNIASSFRRTKMVYIQ